MQRNLNVGIPLDVQWNDIDYMDKFKDFTYDEDKYAGLPEFVDELHNKGMHYVVITDPGISGSEKPGTYPPFDDGVQSDIFLKNPNGTLFLASHPNATSYWTKQLTSFYEKVKIDGLWIDMNEPSNVIDGGLDGCIKSTFEDPPYVPNGKYPLRHRTACMTSKHYSTIHYNEHNLMGYREAAITNQALKNLRQKRPFVISRATFSGQGVHSGHWSGDISSTWDDMRYTIPSMLSFSLFGVSLVGSDICGFNFNTTVPLCARWQSLGAFYPFSRNHNDASAAVSNPAIMGPTVIEATKKSLQMRYLLLPYLYTLFAHSHVFGETVARPLFFEFPEDKNTYPIDEQFLWGPALMIIPVLYEGATNVSAYFPKGRWYESTGRLINSSGEKISFQVPLTDIVAAIRGGYILPAQTPASNTAASRKNPFSLICALDEDLQANGELFWDDGDSLDTYEKGNYTLVRFSATKNAFMSTVVHNAYDGPMDLGMVQISGIDKGPTKVTVNGRNCIQQSVKKDFKMNLFSHLKLIEIFDKVISKDTSCIYVFSPPNSLAIGMQGVSLLSPLTVTWM
ncbi:lysosomal alpha-glucosidase [Caerostris extrusa]|uniref:Lysosomal alpha-glucosidase n=1 Tax=Caerostris extrusa TaxID=172846 RepID=A0AAV4THW3_CAEEX|nr:lysosomal alpha-glucosidase [Caerostris extrusa]